MYIVLASHKDRTIADRAFKALKEEFPKYKFSIIDVENRGTQIRLEGSALEDKPMAYVKGFLDAMEPVVEDSIQLNC